MNHQLIQIYLNSGIVILTNTSNDGGGLFSSVSNTLIDEYLGLDDFSWTDKYAAYMAKNKSGADTFTDKVWKEVDEADSSHINVDDYIGIYKDNWFGNIEVFMNNGQLWIKAHRSPKLNGPLRFHKEQTFAIRWEYQDMSADAFATFTLDDIGKAQGIKMKGISPNIDFSFDFHDLDLKRVKN